MILKLKEIYSKLNKNEASSYGVYRFILGIAIISVSLIVIVETIMQYEQDGLMTLIILLLYLVVMFVLAGTYPKRVKKLFPFITVPLNLIVFPFMFIWAEGGGIKSGMPVWMTMGILLLFITSDGIWFVGQLAVTLVVDIGLMIYAYMNPSVVRTVDKEFYYYEDNMIAICVVSVCIGVMVRYQKWALERQTKKAEEALAEAKQEKMKAQCANEEMNKLLESLSHDVRIPLNSIVGLADMAGYHIEDKVKVQECLEKINVSSVQVLQLINRLLDKAQMEHGDSCVVSEASHDRMRTVLKENADKRIYKKEDGNLVLDAYGKRVLVVEDNAVNMDIICGILERTNAEVICAWNGEEALELMERSEEFYFDMILLDIQLPKMDGYSVCRSIRSLNREDAAVIPIIAMSADVLAQDVDKALKCGMDAHVAKPIDVEDIFTKMCYYLYR